MVTPSEGTFEKFLVEYRYEGQTWAIELPARNWNDAHARVKALAWARCEGQIAAKLYIPAGSTFRKIWRIITARL